MEKQCFKCKATKPLSEFYAHPMMGDGHLNKCKECTKSDVAKDYRAKRPAKQAYDRERAQRPERKRAALEYQRIRRARHPEKDRARRLVNYAVRAGNLIPLPCKKCGAKAQAHHHDYSKPLDVEWLCFKHHREEHGQIVL